MFTIPKPLVACRCIAPPLLSSCATKGTMKGYKRQHGGGRVGGQPGNFSQYAVVLVLALYTSTSLIMASASPSSLSAGNKAGSAAKSRSRILVQYADESGREKVLQMLGSSVVLDTSPDRGGIVIADIISDTNENEKEGGREQESLLRRLEQSPHVKQIEYDLPASFRSVPDITLSSKEREGGFGTRRILEETITPAIKMVQGDQLKIGNTIPLVCNADSGYALGHPDLPLPPEVDGSDMVLSNGKALRWHEDGTGHGTATAGVIAAIEGNYEGVRGVAPGVKLWITRALDDNGKSDVAQLMGAIEQCVQSGAKIISMSLGCPCTDDEHCETKGCYSGIMRAYFASINSNGILVFSAAGNEGTYDELFYPGSYPSVISVGGVNSGWTKFVDSSVHNQVELAALGQEVETTFVQSGTGGWTSDMYTYTLKTGTSIAVPAVAASAALLWSHFPECTNHQIRTALGRTAVNPNGCDDHLGFGIVQVKDAYEMLSRHGCQLDGQIYSGLASVCDGYVTPSPTTLPTQSMPPTLRPTHAPTTVPTTTSPTSESKFSDRVEWWVIPVLVVGVLLLGIGVYCTLNWWIFPKCCRKR